MGAIVSEEQRKEETFAKKKTKDSCSRIQSSPDEREDHLTRDFPSSLPEKVLRSWRYQEPSPASNGVLCSNSMPEIIDHLYIGDVHLAARVLSSDYHMGFSHILSLFSSSILSSFCKVLSPPEIILPSPPSERPVFAHFEVANRGSRLVRLVVPLSDTPEQRILHVLELCFQFIDEGIEHGAVLVHCMAGVSRSAAIVTAYLMRTLKLPLKEALKLLRKKHKRASPNPGFLQQLQWFENIYLREELRVRETPSVTEERLKATMLSSGQSRNDNVHARS